MGTMRIALTNAQQSALECADLSIEETPRLWAAWNGRGLSFATADVDGLCEEINEASNSEDAMRHDPDAAGAAQALSNLASRVREARP